MEQVPPKRLKAENDKMFQEQLKVGDSGNEQSLTLGDNAKFEMLIDVLERFLGSGKDSHSSTLSASQDGAQIQTDKTVPLEDAGSISDSGEDDVKVLEWPYHSSDSGKEFITVEAAMPSKVDQLNCSARLVHADLEIWLHNVGSLMLVDKGFIAKVALINVNELSRATNFGQAKSILLSQFRIVRIVLDDAVANRDNQRAALLKPFDQIRLRIATCRTSVGDAAQILRIAVSSNALDYCELCEQLRALTKVVHDVYGNLDENRCTVMVFVDFSLAFNCVDHLMLRNKLRSEFRFSRAACDLIASYLSDRSQVVRLGNVVSAAMEVPDGTPQGSCLSALLFSLYINSLPRTLKCHWQLYADDLQIYLSGPIASVDQLVRDVNLTSIANWAKANRLFPNERKRKP